MKYILSIDQGTTSTTAMLIDEEINERGKCSIELPQHYPRPGWVEHDPEEIWQTAREAVAGVLEKASVRGDEVAAVGITNQRETTILWDRADGRPLYNGIVWQCRRTSDLCRQLKQRGLEELFREKSGLVIDPYFSGTKIWWMIRNVEGIDRKISEGSAAFGTVDSFLLWKLTGGRVHATDPSNASRTMLFNIHDMKWDDELLDTMGIHRSILPEVKPNFSIFGRTRGAGVLPDDIPIAAMAGDQQAALFGQACFGKDEAKCTYGTGAFLLVNTGSDVVRSRSRLLSSVGWQMGDEVTYVIEGSSFTAGSAVQWLRDSAGIIAESSEIESLAASADPESGVLFVPALTGLGAPHWDPEARGAFLGLTRQASRNEMARAILEGIALQIVDLAGAMQRDTGRALRSMKVDGGACRNDLLMQMQADLIGMQITRPRIIETTAAGTAMMAGLTTELFESREQMLQSWKADRSFEPHMEQRRRLEITRRWKSAVEAVRAYARGSGSDPSLS